jgi:ribonucleoside-triphosphate reductase
MKLDLYQQVIHRTRYARWREEDNRREYWDETVARYFDFFYHHLKNNYGFKVPTTVRATLEQAMFDLSIMPSMRTLMTAGKALESCNTANYNCAYLPVDHVRSFSEHMFILMSGAGSGFSVERRNVYKLPEVPEELHESETCIVFTDSRKGWCAGFHQFLTMLYAGNIPTWDVSKLRPEGSRLKTFGGYSSGPGVLVDLLNFTANIFKGALGRKLKPIEVFSIMCYIAQIVVVGGVRRSATICLFDKDDVEMRRAKSGAWYDDPMRKHYAMANVSAVFESKPDAVEFMDIWRDLVGSGAGEPGVFNRKAVWEQLESFGRPTRWENGDRIPFGVNPCCEIILRPYQFCNLTGNVVRAGDDLKELRHKQEMATILGTWQATISDFDYLRKIWKQQVEEERLLGVCLAGIMDHDVLSKVTDESAKWFNTLRDDAWTVNKEWAKKLGISPTTSPTSVKPAGNSAQLYNTASGIHPRYSEFYVRTVRQSNGDPMTQFLKDQGIPWEVSVQNERDIVFEFPIKSPEGAICAPKLSALDQLRHWMHVKSNYATHTVSCTVYVKPHEWLDVGAWVYKNFDNITGLSFLPYSDHVFKQAPYQPITEAEYESRLAAMPTDIKWDDLKEGTDTTTVSQEFACVGDKCELI